jgi:hypothetical protein
MSIPLPLRLSSLVAKEVHVQNKIVFSNPAVVLTGSNTSLLFDRLHTLENEVSELQANGGGGSGSPEFIFPSITCNTYVCLSEQLLEGEAFSPTKAYNTFGRFAYPDINSALLGTPFVIPLANSETHFRIFNETDLSVFPLTTSLVLEYPKNGSTDFFSMSSELISARNSKGSWTFYTGS